LQIANPVVQVADSYEPQPTNHYLDEIRFRWDHRFPLEIQTPVGVKEIIMQPLPVMDLLRATMSQTVSKVLQTTPEGDFVDKEYGLVQNLHI
jgi:hypothetical protein